jgi:hypothetical protein
MLLIMLEIHRKLTSVPNLFILNDHEQVKSAVQFLNSGSFTFILNFVIQS